jgi:hypothetical protein
VLEEGGSGGDDGLEDVGDGVWFVAEGLAVGPFGVAEDPEEDGIFGGDDDFVQAGFHLFEFGEGDVAFKDGVLDAWEVGAEVFADFADALFSDVVDEDDVHGVPFVLPPGSKGAVGFDAGEVADEFVAFEAD